MIIPFTQVIMTEQQLDDVIRYPDGIHSSLLQSIKTIDYAIILTSRDGIRQYIEGITD